MEDHTSSFDNTCTRSVELSLALSTNSTQIALIRCFCYSPHLKPTQFTYDKAILFLITKMKAVRYKEGRVHGINYQCDILGVHFASFNTSSMKKIERTSVCTFFSSSTVVTNF